MGFSHFSRVAFGVLLIGLSLTAARARIYIADETRNQINIYANNASGNTAPTYTITGSNTGLNMPTGVAVDANYLYVSNYQGQSITIYNLNASGNAAPVATITGSATSLAGPIGIAVNANYIYVANEEAVVPVTGQPNPGVGSITVYALNASGNAAPVQMIGGTFALRGSIFGLAVNANYIFATVQGGLPTGVMIWPLAATGDVGPTYALVSANGYSPEAVAVDANNLYVSSRNSSGDTIQVFALAGLNSSSAATATISGAATGLQGTNGIAVDSSYIYARNVTNDTLTTYPLASSGNAAPTDTLGGINPLITSGFTMAVDATSVPAATHFTVSATATQFAGQAFTLTITALDSTNTSVPSYPGTVHFTSTDPQAVLPADTTLLSGIAPSVTLKTAGNQTITVTDTASSPITGTSNTFSVTPGNESYLGLSVPSNATVNTAFNATVSAYDQYGNVDTNSAIPVLFTSTDALAVLPLYANLHSGTATFAVTLKTAGSQTLTSTAEYESNVHGTSSAIDVAAAVSATHFSVTLPGNATAGTVVNAVVTALDSTNTVVPGYAGTVAFTSSDGSAVLPSNASLTAGVGGFSVTFKTAGLQTFTATDTTTASIAGTSGSVAVAAAAASRVAVSAPGTATAGTAVNAVVTAFDPYGNVVSSYAGVVHFTSTDSSATLPANTILPSGSKTVAVTFQTAGSQTLTATDTVTPGLTGNSAAVVVSPGTATHFTVTAAGTATVGTAADMVVTAYDAGNNLATGYAGIVHFTSTDGSAVLPGNTALTAGTKTVAVTFHTAGSQTVTATDTVSAGITGTSGSVAVSGGAATRFTVSAPGTATSGTAINVVVTAYDALNNIAAGYTGTVHFTSTDGSATLPANATLTSGTGTVVFTFQTVGSQTVTATDTVTGSITGTSGAVAVGRGVAAVVLGGLTQTYTGTSLAATATSVPAVASIGLTYNGSATAPINAGAYSVVATVTDPNYSGGATGTLTIAPANQTIVFTPIGAAVVNTPVALVATASSGLAVTFGIQSGNATITGGNLLTCLDSNPVTVAANQAGDANHNAAPAVTQSVAAATGGGVGVGGIGGAAGVGARRGGAPDAAGANGTIAVSVTGTSGELIGYISSLSAGFTANFSIAGGSFSTTATTLTGSGAVGQTLTLTGTVAAGVVSGTIQPLGLPFSVTLDPTTGTSAAVSGLYQATGSAPGSESYSIVGTQGEVFVLAITASGVAAGTGTVSTDNTFTVTTSQGTTISGSVNAGTTALAETVTPSGGAPVTLSGLSAADSPTVAPATQTVTCGATATLAVTTSAAAPTYQWLFNGAPIAGATTSSLSLPIIGLTQGGTYSAVVISAGTSATSNAATVTVASNAWLVNLSSRATVAPATSALDVLTAGFITTGTTGKQLLVRAAGPALQTFGISGYLPNPSLSIFSGPGSTPTPAAGWSPTLAPEFASLGAFPFTTGSADTAISNFYNAGSHSAVVNAADLKQSGVALVEVYDADGLAPTDRLINLSSLAFSGTGSSALAGGFVIAGTTAETVLVRAVGPRLAGAPFSLPGVLAQPVLQVFDTNSSGNRVIAQIQGWGSQPAAGTSTVNAGLQPATAGVMASVGAFSLASGSADSALVLVLPPGAYTVQVSGASGGTGLALFEVYEVP